MKKNLILFVALFLCRVLLPAQNLDAYVAQPGVTTWLNYSCTGADGSWPGCLNKENLVKVEYPPWIIGGGWRSYIFVNGKKSSMASSPKNLVYNNNIDFHEDGGDPVVVTEPSHCPEGAPWKLNYYCVYSAQSIDHPTAGTVLMGFAEGENYELPEVGQPTSDCGYQEGDVNTTFLCMTWTPRTEATNWGHQFFTDMGPFIWPATGYFFANGQKVSAGCGNNATLQADDGYLYVFYKDMSYYNIGSQMEDGRLPGIKVARAPISDALNPHAYKTFYEDANGIHWNQSLPAGLTTGNIQSYYTSLGPRGTNILALPNESDRDYTRFAVAKVDGTNYYLGVGSYQKNGRLIMTLKYSYDLLHWFGEREIDNATSWVTSNYSYPVFLSRDGWSNTHISEYEFYVMGTKSEPIGNSVYKIWFYIPAPPPPPVCYDNAGNIIDCSNQVRKDVSTPGAASGLDSSAARAPFIYPNPGHGVVQLQYTLKGHAKTQLNVLDLMGRRIQTGATINRTAGTYKETVNISSQAKGVYLLELLVNGQKQTFKMIYQ